MTVKNARTILFASLAVLLIVSFGGADIAFGEVSEEIKAKALEGKQIWEKIEDIKSKEVKTEKDELDEKKFQAQFDAIAKEMNKHGIATPEQWEKNPDYWRMKNAPTAVTVHGGDASEDFRSPSGNTDSFTAPSVHSSPCFCPQEFRFITGFDYLLWGFWPDSAFASSWKSSRVPVNGMISAVTSLEDHGHITPFVKFGLVKPGSASISVEHSVENPYGIELSDSELTPYSVSRVIPDHHTQPYDTVSNTRPYA